MQIERYKKGGGGGGINCEQQIPVVTLLGREKENILLSSVQGRFHLFFPSPLQASLWPPPLSLSLPAIDRQIFGGNCEEEAVVYIFRPVALVEITAALAPGGLSGYGGPSLPPSGLKLCLMSLRISCFLPPLYAKGAPLGWWWWW